jgi:hypothetical protein
MYSNSKIRVLIISYDIAMIMTHYNIQLQIMYLLQSIPFAELCHLNPA